MVDSNFLTLTFFIFFTSIETKTLQSLSFSRSVPIFFLPLINCPQFFGFKWTIIGYFCEIWFFLHPAFSLQKKRQELSLTRFTVFDLDKIPTFYSFHIIIHFCLPVKLQSFLISKSFIVYTFILKRIKDGWLRYSFLFGPSEKSPIGSIWDHVSRRIGTKKETIFTLIFFCLLHILSVPPI